MYYLSYERYSRACMLINKYGSFLAFFHIFKMPNQGSNRRKHEPRTMHLRKYFSSLLLLGPLCLFFACTKNDTSTLILLGTENYVEDILNRVPDTLQNTFEQKFGVIPQGYKPPKIEGDFVVAPKQRCYSNVTNWPLGVIEPYMSLHFTNQHNRVVEIHLTEAIDMFTDTVYVTGYDNFFTVYYQEYKSIVVDGSDAMIKRGIIIKGEMCDDGMKDLYFANIIMEVTGEVSDDLVKPGQFFIYRDGDGLARKEGE